MAVKRNDSCPCGSGKKYKKCCLSKESILHLTEHKEEQFYRQKHLLVEKLTAFFDKEIPLNQYYQLQTEFRRRTGRKISEGMEGGFLRFWLYFFRQFDNGLRGIEWFYEVSKSRLSEEEKAMTERWIGLSPKLVQAVNKSNSEIIFEDIYTKDQFPSSTSKENVPYCLPWCSTFGLIEPFQSQYYFNGVNILGSPEHMRSALKKTDELMKQYKMTREQVLQDFYPEILAEFVGNDMLEQNEENDFRQYMAMYDVKDDIAVAEFLQSQGDVIVDLWNDALKKFSWVDNWRAYKDNEMNGEVELADLFGTIELQENQLITICNNKHHADEMMRKLRTVEAFISFGNEEVKSTKTFGLKIDSMLVNIRQDTPKYFSLYAQSRLSSDIDHPIPKFDDFSIRELVANGKVIEAETWLKQTEYNMHLMVEEEFGKVEVTADFNTIRKELGLSLSPFVTGGEKRKSYIKSIEQERNTKQIVSEEDIPYFEELGFTPDTISNFYAHDLVHFFKEKTIGKTENTVRKYRSSLYDLRESLAFRRLSSWEQCDLLFWKQLITKDFFEINISISKTQLKDFLSTLNAFAKWLDRTKGTSISNQVKKVMVKQKNNYMQ